MNFVALGLILLFLICLFYLVVRTQKQRRCQHWEQFARSYGLRYECPQGKPRVSGELDGQPFNLQLSRRSSDGQIGGVENTVMSLEVPTKLPEGGLIRSSGPILRKMSESVTAEPIRTGDQEFDRRFFARGEATGGYLTGPRREALVELAEHTDADSIELQGLRLSLYRRSWSADRETLAADAERLRIAAAAL